MTYKETYTILKSIADSMVPVGSFEWLMPRETVNPENLHYPAIVFEADPFVQISNPEVTRRYAFLVLDRNSEDQSKRIEMLDRCERIGWMFVFQLNRDYPELLAPPEQFTQMALVEDFADRTTGWRFEITLRDDVQWSECDLLDFLDLNQSTPEVIQNEEYNAE